MVAKYYVAIRPQTNERHAVHKEDCPFLPDDEKRIYLGLFNSVRDAEREGQRHFPLTNSCLFCSKDHLSEAMKPVHSGIDIGKVIPTINQLFQYQKGRMFYFLN